MENSKLILSTLPKTWIIDLDGTLVKHNGYLLDGKDTIIPISQDFINKIPKEDYILIITARTLDYEKETIEFLKSNGIRYNTILFGLPLGERILINDDKPRGLKTSISINLRRNEGINTDVIYDQSL